MHWGVSNFEFITCHKRSVTLSDLDLLLKSLVPLACDITKIAAKFSFEYQKAALGPTAYRNIAVAENNLNLVANAWARVRLRDGAGKQMVVVI